MRKMNKSLDFHSKNGSLKVKIKESKKLFRMNDKTVREEETVDLNQHQKLRGLVHNVSKLKENI